MIVIGGLHSLVPPTDSSIFMERRSIQFPWRDNGGELSIMQEDIPMQGKNERKSVITWTKLETGERTRQWLGFRSSLFRNKDFVFTAWIKFVGEKPPLSRNFGLKVCGKFYNQFLSRCAADEWRFIREDIHCDGGDYNGILLIFDTVEKKGQQVKMSGVNLWERGNWS